MTSAFYNSIAASLNDACVNICSPSSSSIVHPSMDGVPRTANVDECDTNLIMTKTAIRTTDNDH